ncbi:MAG: hypothetical protein ABI771_06035 [Betaproteobacteria bacterium]
MRKFLALLLLLAPFAAQAADQTMLYVEYHLAGKKIAADSFDAQSKKVWRVGDTLLRFEDAPNPTTKIHGLIIVSEPDIWIIDRNTNKGQHTVDPGPTYKMHFPLLASEQSETLRELEFGHELEFFLANNATALPQQEIEGVLCKPLRLNVDDREVTLYTRTSDMPLLIVVKSPDYEYSVRFLRYEPGRKVDKSLFQPPSDAQIKN